MLTDSQVRQFQDDGFLRGSQVLDDAQVSELCEEMERVIRDRDNESVAQPVRLTNISGDAEREIWQVVDIWQASDAFRRLIETPTMIEELSQIAQAQELRVFHDQIQYKPAQKGGVNWWHQDSIYWPIVEPKDAQLTAWIALDDVDQDNGCMSMVPGSHHWGDQIAYLHHLREELGLKSYLNIPREFEGHDVEVRPCPVARGQVHFHHALTWHGSQANISGRPRRAIAIHFMTDRTRYRSAGEHPMKPFVEVADGEKIEGQYFPLVWSAQAMAAV